MNNIPFKAHAEFGQLCSAGESCIENFYLFLHCGSVSSKSVVQFVFVSMTTREAHVIVFALQSLALLEGSTCLNLFI